jgi:hypothetical protein
MIDEKQVLLDAADLIKQHGWTQGTYRNRTGEFCMVGALWAAMLKQNDTDWMDRYNTSYTYDLLHKAMNLGEKVVAGSPAGWNDRPGRTKRRVIRRLRKSAKKINNGS